MRDLHRLVKDEKIETVASAMNRTARSTRDVRAGVTPMTVDDLYRLRLRWPDFDMEGTVMRIGAKRAAK